LRALQEHMIKPVGSNREIPVDVRIIAATNENLQLAQENGNFRGDLFHRLNEFEVKIPPLREREDDILLFARHFLAQANVSLNKEVQGFESEVEVIFKQYTWPGNLREMKNVIKRATLLASSEKIGLNEIPPEIYRTQQNGESFRLFNETSESELIQKVLETVSYNKTKAAQLLKIDRKTLYNKLKSYQIEIPSKK